jgi:predicted transcriptional regulator
MMAMKTLTAEQKQALATLRTNLGGISDEKRQLQKHLLASRKAIQKLLEAQPATVPQIAEALKMPADEALWHLTGMRKYGKVAEAGEDDDYLLYALVAYEE